MKWSDCAIQDLKNYIELKESIINIEERIEILKIKYTGVNSPKTDGIPTHGSGSKREAKLLDNIVERKRLRALLQANKKIVELIEKGLKRLTKEEQAVLYNFYIAKRKGHVEETMKELNLEKSQVYRLKESALEHFTRAMYGIGEY